MRPTVVDGDRLLVRHGGRPAGGRLAVVVLPDGTLAVKRLAWREAAGWWVERDNPAEGVDSWSVGTVREVRAIVVCRVWPLRHGLAWRAARRR